MSKNVSEVIVETLLQAGAKRCYGIVGDTINHFTNVLSTSDLKWVHVRHEEVDALAAGGESYLTQELSVCAGTTGSGSLHFLNGIFESHRNGAPVFMIASKRDSTFHKKWIRKNFMNNVRYFASVSHILIKHDASPLLLYRLH